MKKCEKKISAAWAIGGRFSPPKIPVPHQQNHGEKDEQFIEFLLDSSAFLGSKRQ